MKVFDFGAFQNKMHMASREKYIFHILFGAFHGTPRMKLNSREYVKKNSLKMVLTRKFLEYYIQKLGIIRQ